MSSATEMDPGSGGGVRIRLRLASAEQLHHPIPLLRWGAIRRAIRWLISGFMALSPWLQQQAAGYTQAEALPGLPAYGPEDFFYLRYAMAYHARRGQMILLVHGIFDTFTEDQESRLYGWDGARWQPLAGAPAGLNVMVYDSRREVMVCWQGRAVELTPGPSGIRRKRVGWTWEWDGTHWRLASDRATIWEMGPDGQWRQTVAGVPYGTDMDDLRAAPSPGTDPYYAVYGMAAAYDPGRAKVLMFGGFGSTSRIARGCMYEWDGASWTCRLPLTCEQQSPGDVCPDPVAERVPELEVQGAAMGYDPGSGQMIIHGGVAYPNFYFFTNQFMILHDFTYGYDGERLHGYDRGGLALRRAGHAIVYDEFSHQLVMFGGQTYNQAYVPIVDRGEDCFNTPTSRYDVWDGTHWVQSATPPDMPTDASAKYLHAAAYDPQRHQIVVFGGLYNYRFERNPFQTWYDCLFSSLNSTWRIGYSESWVDYSFVPLPVFAEEDGSFDLPWVNLRRALDSVASESHAVIRLKPGQGSENGPITIGQPRILEAPFGPVTIRPVRPAP